MQIFDHGVIKVWLRAVWIEILVAQEQSPSGGPCALLRDPECAGVAQVHIAGRRRSQPAERGDAAQNRSGMLENAIRVGAAAPASRVLAKQSLVVPYL